MSVYLIINIFIIILPFLLSFENKIKFYKKILPVSISIVTVGMIYIVWDIAAVNRGDWAFNQQYVSDLKLFNLPVEEILFFISVPYSTIFIYESLRHYIKEKHLNIDKYIYLTFTLMFFIAGIVLYSRNYSATVLIFCSVLILMLLIFQKQFTVTNILLITLLISFIPFFAVNYILTSLPVVVYNESEITGFRIFSIPVEDLFYSISMITLWLSVYIFADKHKSSFKIKYDKSAA
ncbi:MAG: lycopene cyclase domain-containing protein [Ignavibacteria bacterium]